MIVGMQITKERGYHNLIVEGESQLPILSWKRIVNETKIEKILTNWRLSFGLSQVIDSV
jgi:hypothetical protein